MNVCEQLYSRIYDQRAGIFGSKFFNALKLIFMNLGTDEDLLKLSQNHLDSGICSVNAVGTNHRVPFLKTRRLFWLLMLLELHLVICLEPSWKQKDRERRRCQLSAQEMTDLTALTVYLDRDSQARTATLKQRTSGSDKLR